MLEWVLGSAWVLIGLILAYLAWRKSTVMDGLPYFLGVLVVVVWPALLILWLIEEDVSFPTIPSYEQWQERRQEVKERLNRPSEVSPALGERSRRDG